MKNLLLKKLKHILSKDGLRDGEHNSVWWRRDRFELISTDTFWLSLSPQTPGSSLGEETGRIVNCVILQARLHNDGNGVAKNRDNNKNSSALAIRFCSTHMPANETLVEKSVPILADQLLNMNFSVDEINKLNELMMISVAAKLSHLLWVISTLNQIQPVTSSWKKKDLWT